MTLVVSRRAPTLALVSFLALIAPRASVDTLTTFHFNNVTFDDGRNATGEWTWNFTTNTLVSVNVLAEGGIFNNSVSYPTHITTSSFSGAYDTQIESWNFEFVLDQPLTPTTGAAITIDPQQSCIQLDFSGNGGGVFNHAVIAGRIDPVLPVPGDLNCDGVVNFADINPSSRS